MLPNVCVSFWLKTINMVLNGKPGVFLRSFYNFTISTIVVPLLLHSGLLLDYSDSKAFKLLKGKQFFHDLSAHPFVLPQFPAPSPLCASKWILPSPPAVCILSTVMLRSRGLETRLWCSNGLLQTISLSLILDNSLSLTSLSVEKHNQQTVSGP